jgi:RNA polymerase sigma-70 factor (ECF subfamily)
MKSEDYSDNDVLIEFLTKGDEKAYTYLIDIYHYKLCICANKQSYKNILTL